MHPLRLIVFGIVIALIGLTVWAFLRLLTEVFLLAGRGVRSLFRGGCCRPAARHGSLRIVSLGTGPSATPGGTVVRCRNEKCQWENRPHARYCAHCGRPLSSARNPGVI